MKRKWYWGGLFFQRIALQLLKTQHVVLATEETRVTQLVSHRPIKCQSCSLSQWGTKVNGSHYGDNPLRLRTTGMQIATQFLPGPPTTRSHRKFIGVKAMCQRVRKAVYIECCQYFRISSRNCREERNTVWVISAHRPKSHQKWI